MYKYGYDYGCAENGYVEAGMHFPKKSLKVFEVSKWTKTYAIFVTLKKVILLGIRYQIFMKALNEAQLTTASRNPNRQSVHTQKEYKPMKKKKLLKD